MSLVLVATQSGCRVFTSSGERETELADRDVTALAIGCSKTCFAVVAEHEIWRRSADGAWSLVTAARVPLQSLTAVGTTFFGGSSTDARMVRLHSDGEEERLLGFDTVPGREEWFSHGPPLGVRALTATADGAAVLAAVHVGGIPRSSDGGQTWIPTLPIAFDVHEVCAHRTMPALAAAATAVGLCVSDNAGLSWEVLDEGLEITNSLAVAILDDEVLFSIQDGPFAKRSQVWRWPINGKGLEIVADGLPEWLDGKIDTGRIAAGNGRAAIADGGGNLWLSRAESRGWKRIATGIPSGPGILIV